MTPQVLQVMADAPTVLILVGKNLCNTNRQWPRICKLCGAVLSTVYGWLPWKRGPVLCNTSNQEEWLNGSIALCSV